MARIVEALTPAKWWEEPEMPQALPYIVTLIALWIVGSAKGPSASGKPYARELNQ